MSSERGDRPARARRQRAIGTVGTIARLVVGLLFLAPAASGRFDPEDFFVALVVFPGALLAWQGWRARHHPEPLDATGRLGFVANVAVFLALYLTPLYAPALTPTSDGVLIFYGLSMILAAVRGYAGCEVLALTNLLLRRDDQVGCLLFSPVDALERRLGRPPGSPRR